MNGHEAYQIFNAVRLHFTTDTYNFFTYDGRVKSKLESFLIRKDKYSFIKLSRLYSEAELPYMTAHTLWKAPGSWVRELFDCKHQIAFDQWKFEQKDRIGLLQSDLKKIPDFKKVIEKPANGYPELFMKFGSMMTVTSFFIVDQIMRITDRWNTEMGTDVFWQHWYFPYLKFKPFFYNYTMFDTTAYQNILGETINGQT